MNREIKFRAWDEGNKTMHTDVEFIKSGDEANDWICISSNEQQYKVEGNRLVFDNPYCRQQIHLMQFTGLKDKNGKEIYEGDVVSMISYNYQHMNNYRWKVIYHPESMSFKFYYHDSKRECYEDTVGWHSFEIIGNVYENSELLSREQNPERSVASKADSKENAGNQIEFPNIPPRIVEGL